MEIDRYLMESSLLIFPSFIIFFIFLKGTIGFLVSANVLFESVNFVHSKYWRHALSKNAISKLIMKSKCKKAIFGLFEIDVYDEKKENIDEIRKTILEKIENKFSNDTVLFAYSDSIFGFFTPVKNKFNILNSVKGNFLKERKNNDILYEINKYITSLNMRYVTSNNSIVKTRINSGVSIYGIQSNSLNTLEENSLFALKNSLYSEENKISIFDKKEWRNKIHNSNKIKI
ncbi:MAG: hypothetical protein HRT99_02850, partial [Mycoplasmatales bacterium]|nr:hypothetical protein [Mycoplasmatales bacterium]